jgi:acylphosphatase
MLQLTATVSGRVQHVGYRSRVVTMARTLDLKGYVKNLADGRVLVVAKGERPDLERFCRAIRLEDPLIKVEDIQVQLSEPKGAWDDFYKISGDGETDSRLDTATVFLKELIVVVKDGFNAADLPSETSFAFYSDIFIFSFYPLGTAILAGTWAPLSGTPHTPLRTLLSAISPHAGRPGRSRSWL